MSLTLRPEDFPNIDRKSFNVLAAGLEALVPSKEGACLWPKEYAEFTSECFYRFVQKLRTFDEASNSVRPFPDKKYIKRFGEELIKGYSTGTPVECEKSRRLVFSWTACAFDLWVMGLKGNVKGLIIAVTHEKAADFVWRIVHLYRDLQKTQKDWNLPPCQAYGSLARRMADAVTLANGSQMNKYYESTQGIQGSGFTLVHIEELSQFRNPSAVWSQAMFVTQGEAGSPGGFVYALTNVSTSQDHLINVKRGLKFQEVLEFDEHGKPRHSFKAVVQEGFIYLAVHYSADPAKDEAWAERRKKDVAPDEWEREMEGNELIYGGQAVYAGLWKRQYHGRPSCFKWVDDHFWIAGLDGGNTMNPAIVLLKVQLYPFQVRAEAEIFIEGGASMEQIVPLYIAKCQALGIDYRRVPMFADPALWARQGARGETSASVCTTAGIPIYKSTNDWMTRKGAVDWLLNQTYTRADNGIFACRFTVNGEGAPTLLKGFYGNYKYEEHSKSDIGAGQVLLKPLKNLFSHVHDALQYVAIAVKSRFENQGSPKPISYAPRKKVKDAFAEF